LELESLNIYDLFILLGAIQGILFCIYLCLKPLSNRRASFFLSIFILGFSCQCIFFALETLGVRGNLNFWDFSPLFCSFLFIAAFYAFVYSLVYPKRKFRLREGLIFLPFLVQFCFQIWGSYWSVVNRNIINENLGFIFGFFKMVDYGSLVMGFSVIVISLLRLKKHDKDIRKNYAEITDFSLRWLYTLLVFLLGILVLFAIPTIYDLVTGESPFNIYYPTWIVTSVMIYWIGYSTYLRNQSNFPTMFHKNKAGNEVSLSTKTETYHKELLQLMDNEKIYLESELSLKMMADRLDLSCGYLSQIINQYEEKNFFDFVNAYRVEEVKRKIQNVEHDHLSLLGIAYESGFKSKSTFNLAFKKLTGLTPSAFKKKISA